MNILGIELSSSGRSVAILRSEPGEAPRLLGSCRQTGGSGQSPMVLVEECLKQAGVASREIDRLAVGLGPGSYTGIRSALALAQGWQLVQPVGVVGVSSVDGLALRARKRGLAGLVTCAIDAQRNELYLATFEISQTSLKCVDPLHLGSREEAARAAILVGPEAGKWHSEGIDLSPEGEDVAEWGATAGAILCPAEALEPIYLREAAFVKAPPPSILPQ